MQLLLDGERYHWFTRTFTEIVQFKPRTRTSKGKQLKQLELSTPNLIDSSRWAFNDSEVERSKVKVTRL